MDPPADLWDRALERAHADGPDDLDRIDDRRRRPSSRWLAATAVAACLLAVVAVAAVVTRDDREVVTSHQPEPTTTTTGGGSSLLAKGTDLKLGSPDHPWRTLDIDAEQHAGEVSGTFRLDDVVVAIECAGTETGGDDLILGGTVTEDPADEVGVGFLVVLVIREFPTIGDRVTFRPAVAATSCAELVRSVPYNLDGGYFQQVDGDIQTDELDGN